MTVSLVNLAFNKLDTNSSRALYQEANEKHNVQLVKRLNSFGMAPRNAICCPPSIASTFMDIGTKSDIIVKFLHQLRNTQRLLTEKEFDQSPLREKNWVKKEGEKLGRILGCDFIIQKIAECRLVHTKTPLKIAVVNETDTLEVTGWEFSDHHYNFDTKLTLYAERIQAVQRTFSREELAEFFTIIEEVNVVDLRPENIILAQVGYYFIDTEFKSFVGVVPWRNLERFEHLIASEDKQYFEEKIHQKMSQPPLRKERLGYCYLESRLESLNIHPEKNKAVIQELEKRKSDLEYVGAKKAGISCLRPNIFRYPLREVLNPISPTL